jgi:hypothetical protein
MHVDMSSVSESSSSDALNGSADALDGRVQVPDHVVYRSFPGETVALNLTTGKYHGLNPVAGRMIEMLSETGSIEKAAAVLATEYDQPAARIEADLRGLCADLIERDLIEVHASRDA